MRHRATVLLAIAALAACAGGESEEGRIPLGGARVGAAGGAGTLPAAIQAQLDSGNAAFRARRLAEAEAHYRSAAGLDPALAAPWMGVAMVATLKGDSAGVRAAMAEVSKRAPSAARSHPVGGAGLPPGHPTPGADAGAAAAPSAGSPGAPKR